MSAKLFEETPRPPVQIQLEENWKIALQQEFSMPYFYELTNFLKEEKKAGKVIYPPGPLIFNAFKITPLEQVKIVVLGQDPYHNPNEAMGLSFSVPKGIRIPRSLVNIYQEIEDDLGIPKPAHGDLTGWATQGVFLLNTMLTVEHGKASSHQNIGWHHFTDAVIQKISETRAHCVFMLWGNFAKKKKALIDDTKHLILEAAHPSPLAKGAFLGCKHFSKANTYLEKNHISPVDWKL